MNLTKPRRVIDRKYREWVKTMPCVMPNVIDRCEGRIDPAHISDGRKGMGSKVSDRRVVPLCRRHHELNGSGTSMRLEELIRELNAEYDALFAKPVGKRETRRRTVAKHVFQNCEACGAAKHVLPWHKGALMPFTDERGSEVWYTCPVSNKEVRARTA